MPTLRRGAGRFLGTAVLAFFLPACSAPPVAPAGSGPLREQTIPHNPPVPEGQREIAISEGEKPTDTPKQPPTAEVRGGASGTDGPEARPWQARHGGSCGQRGDCWATLRRDFALGHDDYRNYYSGENLAELGLGIVAAAPLANTHADQAVRVEDREGLALAPRAQALSAGHEADHVPVVGGEGREVARVTGAQMDEPDDRPYLDIVSAVIDHKDLSRSTIGGIP